MSGPRRGGRRAGTGGPGAGGGSSRGTRGAALAALAATAALLPSGPAPPGAGTDSATLPAASGPAPGSRAATGNAALLPQDFGNLPYNGAYTFVRVRFNSFRGGLGGGFGRGGGPGWAHDYPYADENFIKILDEITLLGPNMQGTNIIDADDPELHRHPIAYVSEPGEWVPTVEEVENISDYLLKGGFLILDDFRSNREWNRVVAIFQAILPGHQFVELEIDEPIFNSFFEIESLNLPPPTFRQYTPVFLGLHEDNDPGGRLMVIANFNNDIGDYWEYSDRGFLPIDLSNEAYKFGVNYVIYALNR